MKKTYLGTTMLLLLFTLSVIPVSAQESATGYSVSELKLNPSPGASLHPGLYRD